jgi:hypothetical protein
MALDITGKIVQVLELQTGTSSKGEWKKQEFILETEEQYPRKICISLWGDKIGDIADIQTGRELITVSVVVESREFNGRWYTDVRAWKIQRGLGTAAATTVAATATATAATVAAKPQTQPIIQPDNFDSEEVDDLPF